ncbi:hypothetical protein BC829DRAFT_489038 [Chytridium lagenaria]|nr:hypothetical protein BC829DRAFT_489038 [Chytridium lagenaria]
MDTNMDTGNTSPKVSAATSSAFNRKKDSRLSIASTKTLPGSEDEDDDAGKVSPTPRNHWASLRIKDQMFLASDDKDSFVIGRAKDCDLCVLDMRVSLRHCQLLKKDGNVILEDLSMNGTLVNGTAVGKGNNVELKTGDTIALKKDLQYEFTKIERKEEKETSKRKLPETFTATDATKQPAKKVDKGEELDELNDALEQSLTCAICRAVFYVPASAFPCMHTFCGSCISETIKESSKCPMCKVAIQRISKNHQIQSIVETFLKNKPDAQRTADEIEYMDKTNIITNEPYKVKSSENDYDDYDDNDDDDEYNSDFSADPWVPPAIIPCPSCPPSSAPDGFSCTPTQQHLSCILCTRQYPNRDLPNQRCAFCKANLCHAYLGGCTSHFAATRELKQIKDFTTLTIGPHFFKSNAFEQQVLRDYCTENNITMEHILLQVLEMIDKDELQLYANGFQTQTTDPNDPNFAPVAKETYSCNLCLQRLFEEICYQYRIRIPSDKLPANARGRGKCWYGRNCRTQSHNQAHAARLDHMCEATR